MGKPEDGHKNTSQQDGEPPLQIVKSVEEDKPPPSTWARVTALMPSLPSLGIPSFFTAMSEEKPAPAEIKPSPTRDNIDEEYAFLYEQYQRLRERLERIEKYYTDEKALAEKGRYFFSLSALTSQLTSQSENRKFAMDLICSTVQTLPRTNIQGDKKKDKLEKLVQSTGVILGLCVYIRQSIAQEYAECLVKTSPNNSALYRVVTKTLMADVPSEISQIEWLDRKKIYLNALSNYFSESTSAHSIKWGKLGQAAHIREINSAIRTITLAIEEHQRREAPSRVLSHP